MTTLRTERGVEVGRNCPIYGTAVYLDCLDCDCKLCKEVKRKYQQICIGIDQSYNNTGISISADGKLIKVKSVWLDKCRSNSERRDKLRKTLDKVVQNCVNSSKEVVCILERIRLQSRGFINIDYIKSIGALNAIITDVCHSYLVTTYSVDTRCWKSQVIGTSKPKSNRYGVPDEKWPTIEWLLKEGWGPDLLIDLTGSKKTKGTFERNGKKYMYNNDAADSAGISMFWFVGDRSMLKEEK